MDHSNFCNLLFFISICAAAASAGVYYSGWEVQNNITKCETLLQSLRQIDILENIFAYHICKNGSTK